MMRRREQEEEEARVQASIAATRHYTSAKLRVSFSWIVSVFSSIYATTISQYGKLHSIQ